MGKKGIVELTLRLTSPNSTIGEAARIEGKLESLGWMADHTFSHETLCVGDRGGVTMIKAFIETTLTKREVRAELQQLGALKDNVWIRSVKKHFSGRLNAKNRLCQCCNTVLERVYISSGEE